jgi:hypothetical protein
MLFSGEETEKSFHLNARVSGEKGLHGLGR